MKLNIVLMTFLINKTTLAKVNKTRRGERKSMHIMINCITFMSLNMTALVSSHVTSARKRERQPKNCGYILCVRFGAVKNINKVLNPPEVM